MDQSENTEPLQEIKQEVDEEEPPAETPPQALKNVHLCNVCSKVLNSSKDLKQHIQTHREKKIDPKKVTREKHKEVGKGLQTDQLSRNEKKKEMVEPHHSCDICNTSFTNLKEFKAHRRTHEKKNTAERLKNKKIEHVRNKAVECSKNTNVDLWKMETAEHSCDVCDENFSSLKDMKQHHKTHKVKDKEVRQFECDVCYKAFKRVSHLNEHKMIHFQTRDRHQCDMCDKSFITASLLRRHIHVVHFGQKDHVCSTCNKAFGRRDLLYKHQLVHTGQRLCLCDICGKGFSQKVSLDHHKLIHTGQKPFVCDICHKGFTQKGNLKDHMLSHSQEKTFVCAVCSKAFSRAVSLKKHELTHSKPAKVVLTVDGKVKEPAARPHVCELCHKGFQRVGHLEEHMLTHTGQKKYQCDICCRGFSRHSSLKRHALTHENNQSSNQTLNSAFDVATSRPVDLFQLSGLDSQIQPDTPSQQNQPIMFMASQNRLQDASASTLFQNIQLPAIVPLQPSSSLNPLPHSPSSSDRLHPFSKLPHTSQQHETLAETPQQSLASSFDIEEHQVKKPSGNQLQHGIASNLLHLFQQNTTAAESSKKHSLESRSEIQPVRNSQQQATGETDCVGVFDHDSSTRPNVPLTRDGTNTELTMSCTSDTPLKVEPELHYESQTTLELESPVGQSPVLTSSITAADGDSSADTNGDSNSSDDGDNDGDGADNDDNVCGQPSSCNDDLTRQTSIDDAVDMKLEPTVEQISFGLDAWSSSLQQTRGDAQPTRIKKKISSKLYQCDLCNKSFNVASFFRKHTLSHKVVSNKKIISTPKEKLKYMGDDSGDDFDEGNVEVENVGDDDHFNDSGSVSGTSDVEEEEEQCKLDEQEDREIVCDVCNETFLTSNALKRHMHGHGGQKAVREDGEKTDKKRKKSKSPAILMCDICGKLFKYQGDLRRHTLAHADYRPHKCDICSKAFTRIHHLREHKLIHGGERNHLCSVCGSGFLSVATLRRHETVHFASKNHICDVCSKAFARRGDLREHKRVHSGVKEFLCEVCHKAFSRLGNMKQHLLSHKEKRPHECDLCEKSFATNCHLQTHRITHTGQRPHECDICSKAFKIPSHLREHMLTHTGEKNHVCEICSKAFSRGSHKKRHMLQHSRGDFSSSSEACVIPLMQQPTDTI